MSMHVVHCLTHGGIGGGQAATFSLARQLKREYPDIGLSVVLPANGSYVDAFRQLPVRVLEFPFEKISLPGFFSMRSLMRELQPDIVHSHGKGAGLYARLSAPGELSFKQVHTYHGFSPPGPAAQSILYRSLESFLLSRTDKVIAVSPSEGETIRATFNLPVDKVAVIPNLVDRDEIIRRSACALPDALEKFFTLHAGDFVVTMIARDDPVKNYPLACSAARIVLRERNNMAFVFIGASEGNPDVGKLKEQFPQSVGSYPVLDQPAAVMKRSNVMLLVSRNEGGLPLVLQEGFCLGMPAVGTNVPGIRDLIEDGVNGLLGDETPEAVARMIERLSDDSALYRSMQERANAASAKLDLAKWARSYYDLYHGLCG